MNHFPLPSTRVLCAMMGHDANYSRVFCRAKWRDYARRRNDMMLQARAMQDLCTRREAAETARVLHRFHRAWKLLEAQARGLA